MQSFLDIPILKRVVSLVSVVKPYLLPIRTIVSLSYDAVIPIIKTSGYL